MIAFPGVPLRHRIWDNQKSPIELPNLHIVDSSNSVIAEPYSNAIFVNGGKLVLDNDSNLSPLFRNQEYHIPNFKVSRDEFGIDDVKKVFPNMREEKLNYEIIAAFAEKVGASIPTVQEYIYIEKQGLALETSARD